MTYVVRVDLDDVEPPIWRELRLASDLTLARLHEILQVTMGWTDSHLHHVTMGAAAPGTVQPFVTPYDEEEGAEGIPEADVRLDQVLASVGDALSYEYDFGDNWQHTVRLESVEPRAAEDPQAVCVAGARACPPEDVGGIGGYGEMLEALAGADPGNEWLADLLAWLPDGYDPAEFSVDRVNAALAKGVVPDLNQWHPALADLLYRAGGSGLSPVGELIKEATRGPVELTAEQVTAAVHPYAHLLRTVGDGLKLTAAGYLPPRIVAALVIELGLDRLWMRKGNREDSTFPVLALRESATSLGLLRKSRGTLLVTKVGQQLVDDPRELLRHIASRLPLGRPAERDAGLLALLITAAGLDEYRAGDQLAPLLEYLGWSVAQGDMRYAAIAAAGPTMHVLDSLTGWMGGDRALKADVAKGVLSVAVVPGSRSTR
ncbi:plasmid pRiA4b ORF-3 family protein [Raineyella fluvialis]|uniref:plasmid pRiA4b ORF-3 family protein n=1 Tax=Raineyella fluvialis TaxID=2662261 RepID=UPI00188DFA6C|nr:plasmid pRiA4b ORF-3 family protein [Raineyella fluvialis]